MKTKNSNLALISIFIAYQSAFAQGSLTPPGAPAPTMKSLDQIEARTAITNAASLVTIAQPGSYYLTHSITVSAGDAIHINTNGVTLDLNGFTISSTAASATAYAIVLFGTLSDITINNGHIRGGVTNNGSGVYSGGGFGYGIMYNGNVPQNVLVSHISVSGCLDYGIFLYNGNSTVVEACTVRTVGGYGIYASTIKSSTALDCGNTAIFGDQVSDCRGQCSGSGDGVDAKATALNCYGYSNDGPAGLNADNTALNCYGYNNGNGKGLTTLTALNCSGSSNDGTGLFASSAAQNCYGESGGFIGLDAGYTATGCFGFNQGGSPGLIAFIANSCGGSSLSVTHNLNCY